MGGADVPGVESVEDVGVPEELVGGGGRGIGGIGGIPGGGGMPGIPCMKGGIIEPPGGGGGAPPPPMGGGGGTPLWKGGMGGAGMPGGIP